MTRMWLVPPKLMCDQHLAGEHSEMHQAVGTLLNHDHGEAVLRGHAEEGNIDTARISVRHAVLAVEMETRGMDHDSPLPEFDDPGVGDLDGSDAAANYDELRDRCDDCAARAEADDHASYRVGARARRVDALPTEA